METIVVGKQSKSEQVITRIRNRQSYKHWMEAYTLAKGQGIDNIKEVLRLHHRFTDNLYGYGSQLMSQYYLESLEQLIKDLGL